MKNISELSLQEVCNYIACMNKLVEEKIVIFKPNKAFIKFNYDKATRHLEKQNIEQKEEIERLNNKNEELLTLYTTEREVKDYYKNIINELENIIDIEINKMGYAKYDSCLMLMKMKIQELKGSDK